MAVQQTQALPPQYVEDLQTDYGKHDETFRTRWTSI